MSSIVPPSPLGHAIKEHFFFPATFRNLNHASFGTYPLPVRSQLRQYQDLVESRPDKFLRYTYATLLNTSRAAIAQLLQVPASECVLVANATTGVNLVLRNLIYKPKDVIVYFDTIYGACEKIIASVIETNDHVTARKVDDYELPCSHAEIIASFVRLVERTQSEGFKVKVAVFDTITSIPGVRFPFERLVEECRKEGILSVVDAAHGVGHIPLDLGKLDADFFVSNCHKWLFTPRGCAVFHVPARNQPLIRTTYPTSHGFRPLPSKTQPGSSQIEIRNPLPPVHESAFVSLFQFVATVDNTPYYTIPAALSFRATVCGGEDRIYAYTRDIAQNGADRVAEILGTRVMDDHPNAGDRKPPSNSSTSSRWNDGGLRDCAIANVLLPIPIVGNPPSTSSSAISSSATSSSATTTSYASIPLAQVPTLIEWFHATLMAEHDTFIPIYEYRARLWARLAGQVYLEPEDFEFAGQTLKELCQRATTKQEYLQQSTRTEGGA